MYATISSPLDSLTGRRFKVKDFIKAREFTALPLDIQQRIQQVICSVGQVISQEGEHRGSAFLLDRQTAIVPAHCLPAEKGIVHFKMVPGCVPVVAKTILDGEFEINTPFDADFKVVRLADPINTSPPVFSVDAASGLTLQINYQEDGNLYVTPHQTDSSFMGYATRSQESSAMTYHGDSGAIQCAVSSGAIFGMHQGQKESLKLKDIHTSLGQVLKEKSQVAKEIGELILNRSVDGEYLLMNASTVSLHSGSVVPEHGNMSLTVINQETAGKPPKEVTQDMIDFLELINDEKSKTNFFGFLGRSSTERIKLFTNEEYGTRLDQQPPPSKDWVNIQFQWGNKSHPKGRSVAAILMPRSLLDKATTPQKQCEIANYVKLNFLRAIHRNAKDGECFTLKICSK